MSQPQPVVPVPPASAAQPAAVYFFATCVIDLLMPQAGMDAIAVLEHAGLRVEFPAAQTCCGQPAYTSGYPRDAAAVARAQLDLFPEDWPIVVPSGSCAGMMRHHWPRLFADDAASLARAERIAARVVEFTDFVATLTLGAVSGAPLTLCLHTSCSARRETDALRSSRALLTALPGVELAAHDHEAECCGFGGTFSVKHPQIAAAMAGDKVDAIAATGCTSFVSADCGCLLNLNATLEKRGAGLRGRHIASLLRERLCGGGDDA